MNLLPQASGTRPRVACDLSAQGVVAARTDAPGGPLASVARVDLEMGALVPGLKPGNVVDRVAVAAAVKSVLESVGLKANSRDADITLVVPDGAVRVLLLEFDALPTRLTESLPIVRFRLKKLLPFDADDAMVSFQVMSTSKTMVRVLAVAIPRDVLSEYETAAREAGFEPGAVIPSTLAALAALEDDSPALVINANVLGVTAAIVRGGILMLHRSVDLHVAPVEMPADVPPQMMEMTLPLVDVEDSAGEWAAQEALPEHGRNPYAAVYQPGSLADSPYLLPTLSADLSAERHNAALYAPTSVGTLTEDTYGRYQVGAEPVAEMTSPEYHQEAHHHDEPLHMHEPPVVMAKEMLGEEIAQAVSVAVAYFEDTLAGLPSVILSAGPLGATALAQMLHDHGVVQADGLRVREVVDSSDMVAQAVTASVPRGWMSGVVGALRG